MKNDHRYARTLVGEMIDCFKTFSLINSVTLSRRMSKVFILILTSSSEDEASDPATVDPEPQLYHLRTCVKGKNEESVVCV